MFENVHLFTIVYKNNGQKIQYILDGTQKNIDFQFSEAEYEDLFGNNAHFATTVRCRSFFQS